MDRFAELVGLSGSCLLVSATLSCNLITGIGGYETASSPDAQADAPADSRDGAPGDVVDAIPARTVEIIATHQAQPGALAVDDQYVYWLNFGRVGVSGDGALRSCKVGTACGDEPNTLVKGLPPAVGLHLDGTTVTFSARNLGSTPPSGTIQSCPARSTSCTPTVLREGEIDPGGLTRAGDTLLWTDVAKVRRCSTAPCSDANDFLAGATPLFPITHDGTQLFFAERTAAGGRIQACLLAASCSATVATLASGQRSVLNLVEHKGFVCWTETVAAGGVLCIRSDRSSSSPTVIAAAQDKPAGIAVDGLDVYWANLGGDLLMHGVIGGSEPEVVLSALKSPNAVVVRGDWIYLDTVGPDSALAEGTVLRVRR